MAHHDTIAGIPTGEPHFYHDGLGCWELGGRTLDVGDTVGPISGYLTYSVRVSVKGPPGAVPARYVLVDGGKIAQTFSGVPYPTLPIFDTWNNLKECVPVYNPETAATIAARWKRRFEERIAEGQAAQDAVADPSTLPPWHDPWKDPVTLENAQPGDEDWIVCAACERSWRSDANEEDHDPGCPVAERDRLREELAGHELWVALARCVQHVVGLEDKPLEDVGVEQLMAGLMKRVDQLCYRAVRHEGRRRETEAQCERMRSQWLEAQAEVQLQRTSLDAIFALVDKNPNWTECFNDPNFGATVLSAVQEYVGRRS